MIVWINGAIKWFQDNNVFTHAVGFALIGIGVAVFFVLLADKRVIGDCIAAFGAFAGAGSGLVIMAHGWSK